MGDNTTGIKATGTKQRNNRTGTKQRDNVTGKNKGTTQQGKTRQQGKTLRQDNSEKQQEPHNVIKEMNFIYARSPSTPSLVAQQ